MSIWRDIDSERAKFGVTIWRTGCEVHIGRRLYRARWISDDDGTMRAEVADHDPRKQADPTDTEESDHA